MQDSSFIRSRDRFHDFENRRQRVFEAFILRESSLFEQVKTKTTTIHEKEVFSEIINVVHRVDSASKRERKRERNRNRNQERNRKKRNRERRNNQIEEMKKNENEKMKEKKIK